MKNISAFWQRRSLGWRFLLAGSLGLAIAFVSPVVVQAVDPDLATKLPAISTHILPSSLAQWSGGNQNYFAAIEPSPVGYLIWSDFPVKVYFSEPDIGVSIGEQRRQQQWQTAIAQAIAEWNKYIPLVRVKVLADTDIEIQRQLPPVQKQVDPNTGKISYSFARNAETTYRFYVDQDNILRHHMTILLSPHQSAIATLSTARHELGHALGIWGHSPDPKDALFSSQRVQSSVITKADINTLQKIYQQPTRLGWQMPPFKP